MGGKDVGMFYKQAMSYLGQGEIDKCIEFFDKALEVDDWYLPAWNDKGVALLEKKYESALECFEKVVLLDPVSSMPLYNKGYVQLILENYTDSILTFESFLERYQNKDDFYKYALYLKGKAHYNHYILCLNYIDKKKYFFSSVWDLVVQWFYIFIFLKEYNK